MFVLSVVNGVNVRIKLIGLNGESNRGREIFCFSCMFNTYGVNVAT